MVQAGEILIILLLALVLLGPTRLPDAARKLGGWMGEIKRAAQELTDGVQAEIARTGAPLDDIRRDLAETIGEIPTPRFEWTGPTAASGPSPADAIADLDQIQESDRRDDPGEREPGE